MARRGNDGGPVTARTLLKAGDKVQARWAGAWWPAEVVAVLGRGRVKVHYTGWEHDWDEAVPRSRLRLGSPPDEPAPALPGPGPELPPGPTWLGPMDRLLRGRPVAADTPLRPGGAVMAEWAGAWWPAEVVAVRDDGHVQIRYPGWGDYWDETVPRDRLALDAPGAPEVTVFLGPDWSLTGRLVEVQPDVLVLEGRGGRRQFVNRGRVAYWELSAGGGRGGG
jgi:hypothetical protein